jgi:hypothetical protein
MIIEQIMLAIASSLDADGIARQCQWYVVMTGTLMVLRALAHYQLK